MSNVQLHLALTHVPVILSITGSIILIIAFFIKNTTVTKMAYFLILAAAIATIPVYLSGEGAEEAVENLSGVSDAVIEAHEEVAKLAMISIAASGVLALAALLSFRSPAASRLFKLIVMITAIITGGLMAQTAHLGGQVRHSEIRDAAMKTGDQGAGEEENASDQKERKDDD